MAAAPAAPPGTARLPGRRPRRRRPRGPEGGWQVHAADLALRALLARRAWCTAPSRALLSSWPTGLADGFGQEQPYGSVTALPPPAVPIHPRRCWVPGSRRARRGREGTRPCCALSGPSGTCEHQRCTLMEAGPWRAGIADYGPPLP